METHVIVVLAILIAAYLVTGGLLFQRVEQSEDDYPRDEDDRLKGVAVLDLEKTYKQFTTAAAFGVMFNESSKEASSGAGENSYLSDHELFEKLIIQVADFVVKETAPKKMKNVPKFDVEVDGKHLLIRNLMWQRQDWDFYGSLFFAATTITTIGYGHIVPKSQFGKLVAVVYAMIGIPLVAAFLAGLSDRIRRLSEKLQYRVHLNSIEEHTKRANCPFCCGAVVKITIVFLAGASIFIGVPAWLFMWKEKDWTFIEGLYFSFITLSTIGFGDYIAAQRAETEGLDWYRTVVVVWIFVGLAWLSSVIGLIQAAITTYSAMAVKEYMKKINPGLADFVVQLESNKQSSPQEEPKTTNPQQGEAVTRVASAPPSGSHTNRSGEVMPASVLKAASTDARKVKYLVESEDGDLLEEVKFSPQMTRPRPMSMSIPVSYQQYMANQPMSGVSPMAAAASKTQQGDAYAVVSMLPQMLQFAMAANSAMNDSYYQTPGSKPTTPSHSIKSKNRNRSFDSELDDEELGGRSSSMRRHHRFRGESSKDCKKPTHRSIHLGKQKKPEPDHSSDQSGPTSPIAPRRSNKLKAKFGGKNLNLKTKVANGDSSAD